jgi:hypothetical protein
LVTWTNKQSYFSKIVDYRNKTKTLEAEDVLRLSVQATAPDLTARVIRFEVKGKVEITAISMAK